LFRYFESQRYDAETHTLLSGFAPPATYIWSRIFKKQNKPPKVDFGKVEQDLGDVNILLKEDVEMEFIHPKELESLYLKPGQALKVKDFFFFGVVFCLLMEVFWICFCTE
jgi:hypothetical protein